MEEHENCNHQKKNMKQNMNNGGSAVYFFGLIGAAVYFISNSSTFWMGVVGFLKALVWPAYLAYYALEFLIK